ncbi:hypothetical protein [Streptomyces sp. ID05-04B]|uniref:hypothetical protein n=1 Tax=Streptomyces sp. ID05-04B TaxID=3028661 RepID=UPI0029C9BAB8|nr:hypothetical protein [Streptomyces sp. ID05-04B]
MPASRGAVTSRHTRVCDVLSQVKNKVGHFKVRKHEETDLAWRAVERWDILYEPQLVLQHSLSGWLGFSQGRRRSAASGRARRSWV